jgi:transposase-like protein
MRDVIRYSEAFKLRLVEEVAAGKYKSLNEAGRRNGIRGGAALRKRMKQYGREDMLHSDRGGSPGPRGNAETRIPRPPVPSRPGALLRGRPASYSR